MAPGALLWGWSRIVLRSWPLRAVPGLRFARALGSGQRGGFGLRAQPVAAGPVRGVRRRGRGRRLPGRIAIVAGLSRACRRAVHGEAARHLLPRQLGRPGDRRQRRSRAGGSPVASLTRASIRPLEALRFWRRSPPAEAALERAEGCLLAMGLGEAPLLRQATFSVWESQAAMDAYARSGAHQEAIRASHAGRLVQRIDVRALRAAADHAAAGRAAAWLSRRRRARTAWWWSAPASAAWSARCCWRSAGCRSRWSRPRPRPAARCARSRSTARASTPARRCSPCAGSSTRSWRRPAARSRRWSACSRCRCWRAMPGVAPSPASRPRSTCTPTCRPRPMPSRASPARPKAAATWRFCDEARRVYQRLEGPHIRSQRPSVLRMMRDLGPGGLATLTGLGPFATLWTRLGHHFHDPRLRQLFGRYATYCGASPWLAPATLMLIAQVEQSGVWSVRGGMHALPQALAELARRARRQPALRPGGAAHPRARRPRLRRAAGRRPRAAGRFGGLQRRRQCAGAGPARRERVRAAAGHAAPAGVRCRR